MPRGRSSEEVEEYQDGVYRSLSRIFGEHNVEKEWDVAKGSSDDFTRELYCPRLDVVVGPFNVDRNIDVNNERIRESVRVHKSFIRRIFDHSDLSGGDFKNFLGNKNENPRCFLAMEIENSGSSKHMLGDVANVSILGCIGVVIPFNDAKLSLCKRIKRYVSFATEVGKIETVFRNVLIVGKEDFLQVLGERRRQ